jgi:intein/homing endonuclease
MADISISFKQEEKHLLVILKAIVYYYKNIEEDKEKGNLCNFIKKHLKVPLKKEYKKIKNDKGIDPIKLYEEYEEKKQGIERDIRTKTKYPTGYDMMHEKLKDFGEEE